MSQSLTDYAIQAPSNLKMFEKDTPKLHSIQVVSISILTSSAANFKTAVKGVLSGTLSLQEELKEFFKN